MHGSIFCCAGDSGSCNDFHRAGGWRVVPRGKRSRRLRSKVVKEVRLEVFLSPPPIPDSVCRAIMARRTRGRAAPPTAERRAAYRDTAVRSRGASLAFSRSFVLILSALCCGYCGADTEFSILEEAQVLADQMKKLSSQELGVFTMQVSKGNLFEMGQTCQM